MLSSALSAFSYKRTVKLIKVSVVCCTHESKNEPENRKTTGNFGKALQESVLFSRARTQRAGIATNRKKWKMEGRGEAFKDRNVTYDERVNGASDRSRPRNNRVESAAKE